jgi:hypothetical protein
MTSLGPDKTSNSACWSNLKGGGQLVTKEGNGEHRGMVSGLGSVNCFPPPTPW